MKSNFKLFSAQALFPWQLLLPFLLQLDIQSIISSLKELQCIRVKHHRLRVLRTRIYEIPAGPRMCDVLNELVCDLHAGRHAGRQAGRERGRKCPSEKVEKARGWACDSHVG